MLAQAPANSVHPRTRAEWRAWLVTHHARNEGVWLITCTREEARCFGWIDSKPNKLDEDRSLLGFAPREAGAGWSKPTRERVPRKIAAGAAETNM